ncbi:MAG: penicillin-binding protein 1C [Bacteroidetes bacterium]|nr:penicillin-binding protein 1C [Bacteroidota bacterium]
MIRLFRKIIRLILICSIVLFISFIVLQWIFPLNINIPYSTVVTASDGTVLHAYLSKDFKWRMAVTSKEVSPNLTKALIQKEDKYFYYHYGVNPVAVARAIFNNLRHQRKTSGASTITMQVIRLLYPAPRTLSNKIVESFRAIQLEWSYSKAEILNLYLNLVPYGGNIEGVKAASVFYFDKLPSALSLAECVTLCIIPNRPNSLRPGRYNDVIKSERNKWLHRFEKQKLFSKSDIHDALYEPADLQRQKAPALIPQLAFRLKVKYPEKNNIQTTLIPSMQHKLQVLVYNYSKRLALKNIYNASAIIIDNKTRKVLAYIGSNDATDDEHHGQVDGVNAVRSPGSTLKPLVYALAIDKGLLTPLSVINDIPVNYMGYSPENFNSRFNGPVTVEFALSHSLNIPAVETLNKLGVNTLTDALVRSNFQSVAAQQKKLGLSVVLGGCGVKLSELSNLYCTFAKEGVYAPLQFCDYDSSRYSFPLISNSAAYLITEMLSKLVRPDMPNNYESSLHIPKIAWKTGTSYGRRDAWSIGYNKRYTIGVWVGNFDGSGVAELTGAEMATPLLFDIFNSVNYNSSGDWFIPPSGVNFRLVCSESGKLPNVFCDKQVMDEFIPGISSNAVCTHEKEIMVSPDEKISYCTTCAPSAGYKKILFPNPDPDLLAFYKSEHINISLPPPHNPSCSRIFRDTPPQISSPVNNSEYIIDLKSGDKLMLSCNVSSDVHTVYWYLNDIFYRAADAGEHLFFTPQKGTIKISCADDKGRNTDINISVRNL